MNNLQFKNLRNKIAELKQDLLIFVSIHKKSKIKL